MECDNGKSGIVVSPVTCHPKYFINHAIKVQSHEKKKQLCCKGHPAQQKHRFLVWSAGKSNDINIPA